MDQLYESMSDLNGGGSIIPAKEAVAKLELVMKPRDKEICF